MNKFTVLGPPSSALTASLSWATSPLAIEICTALLAKSTPSLLPCRNQVPLLIADILIDASLWFF